MGDVFTEKEMEGMRKDGISEDFLVYISNLTDAEMKEIQYTVNELARSPFPRNPKHLQKKTSEYK